MKTDNPRIQDNFQNQFQTFIMLLKGSTMAKISSFLLIIVSLVLAYQSRENGLQVASLLIGALSLIIYIFKFLSLKDIKQKSYTQTSLVSSISKFKNYISNRKKYEMYFMGFWNISLIPFATSFLESKFQAILFAVAYIGIVAILGNLAYKKVDKTI